MIAAIELAKQLRESQALVADLENQIAEGLAGMDQVEIDAERRGMMRAAEIARKFPALDHGHLCVTPELVAVQVAGEVAQAIESAATEEGE